MDTRATRTTRRTTAPTVSEENIAACPTSESATTTEAYTANSAVDLDTYATPVSNVIDEPTTAPSAFDAFAASESSETIETEDSDIARETNRAGEELLAYVDQQIQRMNRKVTFRNNENITLFELNIALSTYEPTLFALTALYEQAKFDAEVAEEKYNEWYYDKYMEIRNTYNTVSVKNSQWLSAKEIDATLFKTYRAQAAALKAEKIKAEGQRSTVERLLRGWENYAFILSQLSKNVNAQMMGSNIGVDMRRGDDIV